MQTSLGFRTVWPAPLLFTYLKAPYLELLRAKFQSVAKPRGLNLTLSESWRRMSIKLVGIYTLNIDDQNKWHCLLLLWIKSLLTGHDPLRGCWEIDYQIKLPQEAMFSKNKKKWWINMQTNCMYKTIGNQKKYLNHRGGKGLLPREMYLIWASAWDFQQCGLCNQQSFRSACAYAQSDQSLC